MNRHVRDREGRVGFLSRSTWHWREGVDGKHVRSGLEGLLWRLAGDGS